MNEKKNAQKCQQVATAAFDNNARLLLRAKYVKILQCFDDIFRFCLRLTFQLRRIFFLIF